MRSGGFAVVVEGFQEGGNERHEKEGRGIRG